MQLAYSAPAAAGNWLTKITDSRVVTRVDDGHVVVKIESQFRVAFGGLKGIITLE